MTPVNIRKLTIILLIFTVGLTVWVIRERHLHSVKQDLASLISLKQQTDEHMIATAQELQTLRERIAAEKSRNASAQVAVAAAQGKLAKVDPSARWAAPPANTPDWNAESPFVWIRKEMVPKFAVPVFAKSGALQPDVAAVFAVDTSALRSLNSQLNQIVTEYHALEAASAKPIAEHLAGSPPDGTTVTIQVPPLPEDGARFKTQFEAALNAQLGPQRADILLQTAAGWIDEQFSRFGNEPKIISLSRLRNGGFSVSIKSGGSWFSCGVPKDYPNQIQEYIPPHLLPLFRDILTSPGTGADPSQANNH